MVGAQLPRSVMPLFAAALLAGSLDILIKCPFERLKTQLQATGSTDGVSTLLHRTWQANGVRGLWSGLGATLARDVPYLVLNEARPVGETANNVYLRSNQPFFAGEPCPSYCKVCSHWYIASGQHDCDLAPNTAHPTNWIIL